ncbi:MAG TPA: LLM class F420-dependent oxidoreductase [Solirubrobacterales bacterium]|jgi:probable F420-dependent oxidoreductase|nr:LLM class F420-dependent oxidoreductase [Solirubrobacterales bacterium]
MRFGIAIFPTDEAADPATIARLVEERGFESLFFTEHTHIPASRRTPYPPGGELPREYSRTYDPFVALTAAAAATVKLLIGTGICLVIERDPIITAKEVSSVDRLSGGRFLFGVGAGWNIEEMENHGTDPVRRFSLMRERIEAMKAIWTADEASYHGEHVEFDRIWCWPKPIQQPHPPVLVGGNAERVLDRVVAFGDEWMPNRVTGLTERIRKLQQLAADAGRDPIPVTLSGARPDRELIERGEQLGVHRCTFYIRPADAGETERQLDALRSRLDPGG